MIGIRIGPRLGPREGPRVGFISDDIVTLPRDGPLGAILVPMTGATFLATSGRSATHGYDCQEFSGNAIDRFGAIPLVPNAASPLYRVAVPGWSRYGFGFNEIFNQRFAMINTGPNPTLTPIAMLAYVTMRTVGALRGMLPLADSGGVAGISAQFSAAQLVRTKCAATTNDGALDHRDGLVHPILLTYDAAASTTNRYTDLEKDNGTFAAGVLHGFKGIGATSGIFSWAGECLAMWILSGASAQFTDAQAKTFLQSLGWTIPWT